MKEIYLGEMNCKQCFYVLLKNKDTLISYLDTKLDRYGPTLMSNFSTPMYSVRVAVHQQQSSESKQGLEGKSINRKHKKTKSGHELLAQQKLSVCRKVQ